MALLDTIRWRPGEHVANIGPTGYGKSTITFAMLKKRQNIIFLANKKRDDNLSLYFERNNYEIIKKWPPTNFASKVALWPKFEGTYSFAHQRAVFHEAIDGKGGIFSQGGWTVVVDEVLYLCDTLNLDTDLKMLWTQGRSDGISVIGSAQRPRDVPQLMLSQSTHFFLFKFMDIYEVRRIADMCGEASEVVRKTLPGLQKYQYLYVNKDTGRTAIGTTERIR